MSVHFFNLLINSVSPALRLKKQTKRRTLRKVFEDLTKGCGSHVTETNLQRTYRMGLRWIQFIRAGEPFGHLLEMAPLIFPAGIQFLIVLATHETVTRVRGLNQWQVSSFCHILRNPELFKRNRKFQFVHIHLLTHLQLWSTTYSSTKSYLR